MKRTFSFNLRLLIAAVSLFSLLATSCRHPYFIADNFKSATASHKTIAIMPVEMHFTGKPPEKLTKEQIAEIEAAESQAFQASMYNEILRSTNNGKNPIKVNLLHYSATVQKLKDANISIRDSWQKTPEELSKILGVDAVVKTRIEKERLMSDLQSYGIQIAKDIVFAVTDTWLLPIYGVSSKAREVNADYSLLSGQDGATLWSISFREGADWSRPSNDIIDKISRRAAKSFPYRKK